MMNFLSIKYESIDTYFYILVILVLFSFSFKLVIKKLSNKNDKYHISYVVSDYLFFLPFLSYFVKLIFEKHFNTYVFLSMNIFILFYFFIRFTLPGKAWELILTNKHSKNLDTFMVVIGLVFAAAFGAITSLDIEKEYFNNTFSILLLFIIFITTNIVIMTILVFLSTYVIGTMGNRKAIMFMLVIFIGIGLLLQETLSYNKAYNEYLSHHKVEINATKK